ncbi:MAG: tRNA (guanosine(37)-N1)-methyltransferase TrmD [Bacilli bacterium]|nr:tRNA (guanosine(37)-N1)-methyltransferase TrmD [Bacilli bacterium]MDD3896185.1 tRNA (guanosine(37)-N1)-methyltransferase TrmD [Bacilli bacterium]
MKISILSLFPSMFDGILNESIIKRAIEKQKIEIEIINFRAYSPLNNNQVDDTPYGGGAGMVLRCEPIFNALDAIKTKDSHIILMCPTGKLFKQTKAKELTSKKHLIIICGHYEGFDERIKTLADEIISIGDYILTGGEIPAMVVIDSVVRLLDGVINETSLKNESFDNNLLDYPVYTKPAEYKGLKVPEVLLSGNHKKINKYREEERLRITKEKRSDLIN